MLISNVSRDAESGGAAGAIAPLALLPKGGTTGAGQRGQGGKTTPKCPFSYKGIFDLKYSLPEKNAIIEKYNSF